MRCARGHRGVTYGLVEPIWEQCRVLADRLSGNDVRYAGSVVGTRLKVAGVNVVALGTRDREAGDDAVVLFGSDGSYRKAIARNGRLVGAQVVGDAAAAASFSRAFASAAPLPASLPSLVFGTDAAAGREAIAHDATDDRVCRCNDVSRATIIAAIESGARDVAAIGDATTAGTGCGTCQSELGMLLRASVQTG